MLNTSKKLCFSLEFTNIPHPTTLIYFINYLNNNNLPSTTPSSIHSIPLEGRLSFKMPLFIIGLNYPTSSPLKYNKLLTTNKNMLLSVLIITIRSFL